MIEQSAHPLSWPTGWPRTTNPTWSRFGHKAAPGMATARDQLLLELRRIGADKIVISTNAPLRRDGLFHDNRKEPEDAGAAVYFTLRSRRQVLACDKWKTIGENLWAMAKHVDALRGQDRWGVGSIEQAFAGYAALEEKTQASCWDVLGIELIMKGTDTIRGENTIMDAYRRMARVTHPDNGGNAELFSEVVRAKDTALQLIKQ